MISFTKQFGALEVILATKPLGFGIMLLRVICKLQKLCEYIFDFHLSAVELGLKVELFYLGG
jgi:hypothetical protein